MQIFICRYLFVDDNCTESANLRGCEAVWNTDVTRLYSDLIEGTLSTDRLKTFCRF